ncbi:MAG: hypothetical protein GX620_05670 [Chloroflexi bacterium]|nr:hypothetical protein [Chloroflexota bacterium]
MSRREWVLFAGVLLLATALRLSRLSLIEFKYDEATTARSALAIAREGQLPAFGMISSLGPHNPPLMSYLLAPAFAVSRDPRLAAGWIALLGVAAVGLTYWIGKAYLGRRVGLLAALLFAASPWAVFHCRKIWAQNVPAFTLLFIASTLAFAVRRKPWALVGAFATAACLVSLHLGGLAFFVVLAFVCLLFLRHVRLLPLVVGAVVALLILGPYLVADMHQGWPNVRAFGQLAGQASGLNVGAPRMAVLTVGGHHLEDLAGERYRDYLASIVDLRWVDVAEMAVMVLGLVWMIWRVLREALRNRGYLMEPEATRLVVLIWMFVPVALLLRHAGPVYPHTVSLLYPAQHLVVAVFVIDGLAWCHRRLGLRRGRRLKWIAVAGTLLTVVWQVYYQQALLTFTDTVNTPGGYGAPIKYALAAAREAETMAADLNDAAVIAVVPGADPRYDSQAAVFDVLLSPGKRLVDGRTALIFPQQPGVYLMAPDVRPADEFLADVSDGVLAQSVLPLRAGSESDYRVLQWQPVPIVPSNEWSESPVQWASGAVLLGYEWAGAVGPGETLRWAIYWRVVSQPPMDVDLHWFNHLIGSDGGQWGQADGVGLPAETWRTGDTVVNWFDVPIRADAPEPPYFMVTGMYSYPDIVNVQLLDVAGNPVGEFVELGPIDVAP